MNFPIPSHLVAIVLTVAAGWLVGCSGGTPARAAEVDSELAALLPPDAVSLMGVDVARLREAAVYRYLEEEGGAAGSGFDNSIEDFVNKTGFDPRQDLESLLVASWGEVGQIALPRDAPFLVAARGRFDPHELGDTFRNAGALREDYRGIEVYSFGGQASGGSDGNDDAGANSSGGVFSMAFLDAETALAGPAGALRQSLDRRLDGGPSLADNAPLIRLAENILGGNHVWAVSRQPGRLMAEQEPGAEPAPHQPAMQILKTMEQSTFSLALDDGLDMRAEGLFPTAEGATLLGDAARGLIAMGRLMISPQNAGLTAFLDSIDVAEDATAVKISIEMDMPTFRGMIESLKATRSQSAQGAIL